MHNLSIDFAKNSELREAFSHKSPGDKCTFEVEMQVNEMDDQGVRGSINRIELEGYEPTSPDKEKEIKPDAEEPVMVVIVAPKSKKSDKAPEESTPASAY